MAPALPTWLIWRDLMVASSRPPDVVYLPMVDGGQPRFTKCRWACGYDCFHEPPNQSDNESFASVVERAMSRRGFLKAGGLSALVLTAAAAPAVALERGNGGKVLGFSAIEPNVDDAVVVPDGYDSAVVIRWGDPITADAPDFDFDHLTTSSQAGQFGYNNDFLAFLPLPRGSRSSRDGLLFANHEFTNPELMFAGYDANNPTKEQVDVELAAHGLSVVRVRRPKSRGPFQYDRHSRFNRRTTATTPMLLTGPAAGDPLLRTSADTSGRRVLGSLNNCAGGTTPWGTVLSGEENFNQYFANLSQVADTRIAAWHRRYGLSAGASQRKWERFYDRFDLAKEPNEPFRFGWTVELDPYDPESTPRKHTALGRLKHEGATVALARDGRAVVYMGDDEVFEYTYKFVSKNRYRSGDRAHNLRLLEEGTLYVARFEVDGGGGTVGRWLPMRFGEGPLTPANGFNSQAEVLTNARAAADLLGPTKMDRPEDMERNPANGAVYAVYTNNTARTAAQVDAANPRPANRFGHVIELRERGDDPGATTFEWEILLLCGDPNDPGTFFAGFPKDQVSPIGSPDNCAFDGDGNLWLATDGTQPRNTNNALLATPVEGSERGHLQMFATVPVGAETCGPLLTPDSTSLFIAVQHPGEGGTLAAPISSWPDGREPRPAVVSIWRSAAGDPTIGR
jgi:uncharacterized protein